MTLLKTISRSDYKCFGGDRYVVKVSKTFLLWFIPVHESTSTDVVPIGGDL